MMNRNPSLFSLWLNNLLHECLKMTTIFIRFKRDRPIYLNPKMASFMSMLISFDSSNGLFVFSMFRYTTERKVQKDALKLADELNMDRQAVVLNKVL